MEISSQLEKINASLEGLIEYIVSTPKTFYYSPDFADTETYVTGDYVYHKSGSGTTLKTNYYQFKETLATDVDLLPPPEVTQWQVVASDVANNRCLINQYVTENSIVMADKNYDWTAFTRRGQSMQASTGNKESTIAFYLLCCHFIQRGFDVKNTQGQEGVLSSSSVDKVSGSFHLTSFDNLSSTSFGRDYAALAKSKGIKAPRFTPASNQPKQ